MEKKNVTKRVVLSVIGAMMNEDAVSALFPFSLEDGTEITVDDVVSFVDKSIEQIDKKNEAAKERNAKKKAESDELRAKIKATLVEDEFKTIADIMAELTDVEDLTNAKVVARLTQLCKTGEVVKDDVKVEGRGKLKGYALAGGDAEAVE